MRCKDQKTKKCCENSENINCCNKKNQTNDKENNKDVNPHFETDLHPVKPLELLNFTGICDDGSKMQILYLCGDLQHVIFKNAQYLLGKYLTFVVPTHICDDKGKMYYASIKCNGIEIQNMLGTNLDLVITESDDCCAYYISIPVTENSFTDCDLVLQFTKFQLNLTEISESKCERACKCSLEWKWIASVVLDDCC